jgi:uncharacterized membrane protein YfcA
LQQAATRGRPENLEWIDFITVGLAAFFAAGLTLYSGFGLGTLMLPVFALFFPVEMAVVATALVHGANNLFKVSLLGRHADREVVVKFGLTAVFAAILGALALGWLAQLSLRMGIAVNETTVSEVTPVKIIIGILMIGFALFELLPKFRKLQFDRKYLPLGGLLSGFFGGLSGHQGALRSAFLAKTGLTTERFVGSNAVIGFLVDLSRISVYLALFAIAGRKLDDFAAWPLVITGSLAAFCGVLVGKRYLHKVTMTSVQTLVGVLLFGVGLALVTGIL